MQERFRPIEPDTDNAGVGSIARVSGTYPEKDMSFLNAHRAERYVRFAFSQRKEN